MFSQYDEEAYKMTHLLIPLRRVTTKNIYISCTPKNISFAFLKEIYFYLDKTMRRFVDCPVSLDTRGCGLINNPREIIIPIKSNIYHL
ncbi:hypothetical protein R3W88_013144 [Solanum pinnatisectum]|uniref:Uncharacterized protein n=1 Tax=Solanum pinnatisectum TaxID=50273 RepID=A0AAV9LBC6_9SOLN|nr:hypothetical protein R3W88_013144 [Solanum pinnatisectum]